MKPILLLSLTLFIWPATKLYSQELEFTRNSIRTGIGIGYNEGKRETGIGLIYSIGLQKSYGNQNRLRLNPNLIIGGFLPLMTDTRDQFYRITSLGMNLHYDALKLKSFSLVTSGGVLMNYSRGLLGTGGYHQENIVNSEYFNTFYMGGSASIGVRMNPPTSKLAFELRPLNLQFGNNGFVLGYMMLGIDFKIKK